MTEYNELKKQETIQQFKNEGLIDEYGQVDYNRLFKEYGVEEADNFFKLVSNRDILLTISLEKLKERAVREAGYIYSKLKDDTVVYGRTKDLLELLNVIMVVDSMGDKTDE